MVAPSKRGAPCMWTGVLRRQPGRRLGGPSRGPVYEAGPCIACTMYPLHCVVVFTRRCPAVKWQYRWVDNKNHTGQHQIAATKLQLLGSKVNAPVLKCCKFRNNKAENILIDSYSRMHLVHASQRFLLVALVGLLRRQAVQHAVAAFKRQGGHLDALRVLGNQVLAELVVAGDRPAAQCAPAGPGWGGTGGGGEVRAGGTMQALRRREPQACSTAPSGSTARLQLQNAHRGKSPGNTQQGTTAKGLPWAMARSTTNSAGGGGQQCDTSKAG